MMNNDTAPNQPVNEGQIKNSGKIFDDESTLRRKKQNAEIVDACRESKNALEKIHYKKRLNAERCRRYRQKCKQLKDTSSNQSTRRDTNETGNGGQIKNNAKIPDKGIILRRKKQNAERARAYRERKKAETENITALDKFKRRLVRDIARRLYQEKQTEDEMFEQLRNEYGCDCKLLWDHMKSLTLKKLKRLLAADDRTDYITKIARMTSTDWLTFDLVLVHEKLDVIGEDMVLAGKSEPAVHSLLFELVRKHDIEGIAGLKNAESKCLLEAWFTLTQEYNTGGRECSPMLLQRRWYQLKQTTRTRIYDFWKSYRGNPNLYQKATALKPTQLQTSIVETYPIIITDPFEQWEELIKKKKVMLASAFEIKRDKDTAKNNDGEPDLIVIEPKVETIELGADSDTDEDNKDETTDSDKHLMGVKIMAVKSEPIETFNIEKTEHVEKAKIDTALENEKSNPEQGERGFEMEAAADSEILLPKITSVMGSVILTECDLKRNASIEDNIQVIAEKSVKTLCEDDDDDVQIITAPISKESILIDDDPVSKDLIVTDDNKISSNIDDINKITDNENDDVKIHSVDGNVPELSLDLNFVDDGIEVIDDADYEMEVNPSTNNEGQDCDDAEENDIASKIDPKLIMFPITYTRKIDDMNVFQNSSFLTVKGNDIIERAVVESKPVFFQAFKGEQLAEEECEESKPIPRLKFSDWRLQKPRNRSYNPIQLCKNPDFNTRLKKITVGFFLSERNRLLFSACKPLTIDLHKGFEDSLVDNTLYLEASDSPIREKDENVEARENTVSVIPSAVAVQCLLDNTKLKVQELLQTKEEKREEDKLEHYEPDQGNPEDQTQTTSVPVETHNVVKLIDIEQIRNQNLLVAEVSPMPLQNNTPPVQLVNTASPVSPQPVSSQCDEFKIPSEVIDLNEEPRTINYVHNDPTKRFVKKRLNAIPKIKPSNSLPAWSQPSPYCPVPDESLITKDTLQKMLCLLNGCEVPTAKNKYIFSKKTLKNFNKELRNKKKNKTMTKNPPSNANVGAAGENDKIDLTKGTLNKRKRKKTMRTVSSKSGFCCWAQYKLHSGNLERKLKHLCHKPHCKCCCRDILVNKMLYEQGMSDTTLKIGNIIIQDVSPSGGVATDDANLQQFNVQNNVQSTQSTPSTQMKVTTVDENNINSTYSIKSHLSNDGPLSDVASESLTLALAQETFLAAKTLSKAYESQKQKSQSAKMLIKTRILNGSWSTRTMNSVVDKEKSLNVEPSLSQPDNVSDLSNNDTEPVIVIDEDEAQGVTENNMATAEQILPKGISIVLLPDKRVSIAIDPDAQVDPAELAKVPDILLSVQKYFADVDIIQLSQNDMNCDGVGVENYINSNVDTNEAVLKDSNLTQIVDANVIVNQEPAQNVLQDTDITDVAFNVTVSQNENVAVTSRNDNINESSADDSQQSNAFPLILKSDEQIVTSTHSYIGENPVQTETETHLPNTQDDADRDVESDVSRRITNRKTILSDLMAMSGISQEDSAVPVEEPAVDPTPIPITPRRILNYSVYNNAVDLGTERKIIKKGKQIKKVIVSIRKKQDQNFLLPSNSVIDLTEDCDYSKNVEEIANQEVDTLKDDETPKNAFQNTVTIKSHLKRMKVLNNKTIHPSPPESPIRVYKAQPLILKKVSSSTVPFKIVKSNDISTRYYQEVGFNGSLHSVGTKRTYRKSKHKPIVYDYNDTCSNAVTSENDSSDDEPLAKKIRRIKASTVQPAQSDDASTIQVDNILPVESYNIPIEFSIEPDSANVDINSDFDTEAKSI